MATIRTGHAQVVSSCMGAEFSTGGTKAGQAGRGCGPRPVAGVATQAAWGLCPRGDWGQRPSDGAPCWRRHWRDWAWAQDLPPRFTPSSALALLCRPARLTHGACAATRVHSAGCTVL